MARSDLSDLVGGASEDLGAHGMPWRRQAELLVCHLDVRPGGALPGRFLRDPTHDGPDLPRPACAREQTSAVVDERYAPPAGRPGDVLHEELKRSFPIIAPA